jgi:hypothetical protein
LKSPPVYQPKLPQKLKIDILNTGYLYKSSINSHISAFAIIRELGISMRLSCRGTRFYCTSRQEGIVDFAGYDITSREL